MTRALSSDDPRRAELGQITQAGDRAAALTQQLLAISRRRVLRPKLVDLNQLLMKRVRHALDTPIATLLGS